MKCVASGARQLSRHARALADDRFIPMGSLCTAETAGRKSHTPPQIGLLSRKWANSPAEKMALWTQNTSLSIQVTVPVAARAPVRHVPGPCQQHGAPGSTGPTSTQVAFVPPSHELSQSCSRSYTPECVHMHTHAHITHKKRGCTHTTHMCLCTCTCTQSHTCVLVTCVHTHACNSTSKGALLTCTQLHLHVRTCSHAQSHMCDTHAHLHVCAYSHARSHTRVTHAYTDCVLMARSRTYTPFPTRPHTHS